MKKVKEDLVWNQPGYTDKIHFAVKYTFETSPIAFSVQQMVDRIRHGFSWLTVTNERQSITLHKIVKTAITRLVQRGIVRQVFHKTQTDPQWMWAKSVSESAYRDITNNDLVAKTSAAVKAIQRRAIGIVEMFQLNQQTA